MFSQIVPQNGWYANTPNNYCGKYYIFIPCQVLWLLFENYCEKFYTTHAHTRGQKRSEFCIKINGASLAPSNLEKKARQYGYLRSNIGDRPVF